MFLTGKGYKLKENAFHFRQGLPLSLIANWRWTNSYTTVPSLFLLCTLIGYIGDFLLGMMKLKPFFLIKPPILSTYLKFWRKRKTFHYQMLRLGFLQLILYFINYDKCTRGNKYIIYLLPGITCFVGKLCWNFSVNVFITYEKISHFATIIGAFKVI